MKNFKSCLLIILLALFTTACQQAQPEPKDVPLAKPKSEPIKPAPSRESDFIPENFTEENEYSKVFKNCFQTGKIGISKSCQTQLNTFLKETALSKKRNIIIEVHTDKGGTQEKNLRISKKRAYAVASKLYYKEYKYSKVYYQGFGEEKLLYDAKTDQADRENRRLIVRVKEKDAEIDSKLYSLYIQKKKIAKKTKMKSLKKKTTVEKVDLKKYTGKADTGWIYFGKEELKKKFDISCAEDKPRKVKRKDMKEHTKEEFVTGMYKRTFKAKVGKQTLRIAPVSLFDNGYLPKINPNILLTNPNQSKVVLTTIVNSYNGENGMLYRVFINKKNSAKSDMECMDLVISYKTGELEYGVAYFKRHNHFVSRELK